MPGHCRYGTKKLFADEDSAVAGAEAVREKVQAAGGRYDQLYPYQCPDSDHWHLSHHRQGHAKCAHCGAVTSAWDAGTRWIIVAHDANDQQCPGSLMAATGG